MREEISDFTKKLIEFIDKADAIQFDNGALLTSWVTRSLDDITCDEVLFEFNEASEDGLVYVAEITLEDLSNATVVGNEVHVANTEGEQTTLTLFKVVPMSFDETHAPKLMSREEGEKLYRQLVFDYSLDTPHSFDDVYEIMKLPEANASEENKLRAVTDIVIKMLQCRIDLLRDSVFGEDAKIMTVVETPRNDQ